MEHDLRVCRSRPWEPGSNPRGARSGGQGLWAPGPGTTPRHSRGASDARFSAAARLSELAKTATYSHAYGESNGSQTPSRRGTTERIWFRPGGSAGTSPPPSTSRGRTNASRRCRARRHTSRPASRSRPTRRHRRPSARFRSRSQVCGRRVGSDTGLMLPSVPTSATAASVSRCLILALSAFISRHVHSPYRALRSASRSVPGTI